MPRSPFLLPLLSLKTISCQCFEQKLYFVALALDFFGEGKDRKGAPFWLRWLPRRAIKTACHGPLFLFPPLLPAFPPPSKTGRQRGEGHTKTPALALVFLTLPPGKTFKQLKRKAQYRLSLPSVRAAGKNRPHRKGLCAEGRNLEVFQGLKIPGTK